LIIIEDTTNENISMKLNGLCGRTYSSGDSGAEATIIISGSRMKKKAFTSRSKRILL
jgi:hypothetical protein